MLLYTLAPEMMIGWIREPSAEEKPYLAPPWRDLPAHGRLTGRSTFSLRSPVRPDPIGTSIATLVKLEGSTLLVRGLDCLNETPLLDLKPDRTLFTPIAPPQPGDFQAGDP